MVRGQGTILVRKLLHMCRDLKPQGVHHCSVGTELQKHSKKLTAFETGIPEHHSSQRESSLECGILSHVSVKQAQIRDQHMWS